MPRNALPAKQVCIVDSHTEGEPTRVVVSGGPDLGDGDLAQRVQVFRAKYDSFRSGVVGEPRVVQRSWGRVAV